MANILIIGMGPIGSILTHQLDGNQLHVVVNKTDQMRKLREKGVMHQPSGEVTWPDVYNTLPNIDLDLVLVATQAHDLPNLLPRILTMYRRIPTIILQNGMLEQLLEGYLSKNLFRGIISFGGYMEDSTTVIQKTTGPMYVGSYRDQPSIPVIAGNLNIQLVADIRSYEWSKLALNCMVNGLCAISGFYIDQLFEPPYHALARQVYVEVHREALAHKVTPAPLFFDPQDLVDASTSIANIYAELREHYPKSRPSTLQRLASRRPTETEYINGALQKFGHPVPLNTRINSMIKEIEAGKRTISKENIDSLLKYV